MIKVNRFFVLFLFLSFAYLMDNRKLILFDHNHWIGDGIPYGPFRDDQYPGGPAPSINELRQDLNIISNHWNWIRVYGSRGITRNILDIIKIASCSFTDWPLLTRIAGTNMPIIAAPAGSTIEEIDNVVAFFTNRHKDLTIMHCVGEYPTETTNLQLNQIGMLVERYPDVKIVYSTHEDPNDPNNLKKVDTAKYNIDNPFINREADAVNFSNPDTGGMS